MSFRTVILTKDAKISLRMNHLVVKSDEIYNIPLSEIDVVVIENPNIIMTGHILNALSKKEITTFLCDSKHMPSTIINSIYSHSRQSKNIKKQVEWNDLYQKRVWAEIIRQKILHQANVVKNDPESYERLVEYANSVEYDDLTNREAYAAKVYYRAAFGDKFARAFEDDINAALDYGYAIVNAAISRAIVSKGYLTEIGIKHKSEYNLHNLSSDIIEIFRPYIDKIVLNNIESEFDTKFKRKLLEIFDIQIKIDGRKQYFNNAVNIYLDSIINAIETGDIKKIKFPVWE